MRLKPHKIKKRALALTLAAAVAVSTPMGALADTYDLSKGDITVTVEKNENGEDDVWVKQKDDKNNEYLSEEATDEKQEAEKAAQGGDGGNQGQDQTGNGQTTPETQEVVPSSNDNSDTIIRIGDDGDTKTKEEAKKEVEQAEESGTIKRIYDAAKGLLQTSPVKIKQEKTVDTDNDNVVDTAAPTDNTITVSKDSDSTAKFTLENVNIDLNSSTDTYAIDIGRTDTEITLSGYNNIAGGNVHIDGNAENVSLTIKGDGDSKTDYTYTDFETGESVSRDILNVMAPKAQQGNYGTPYNSTENASIGTNKGEAIRGTVNVKITDGAGVGANTWGGGNNYSDGAALGTGGSADITGTLNVTVEKGAELYADSTMSDGAAVGTGEDGDVAKTGTLSVTATGEGSKVQTGGNIGTGAKGSIAGTVEVTADNKAAVTADSSESAANLTSAGIGTKSNNRDSNANMLDTTDEKEALNQVKTEKGIASTGEIKVTAKNGATVNAYSSIYSYMSQGEGAAGIGTGGKSLYHYNYTQNGNSSNSWELGYGGNNIAGAIEVTADNGGVVNAGGVGGAGIGTGSEGNIEHSGSITIGGNGGTVNANGFLTKSYTHSTDNGTQTETFNYSGGGAGVGTGEYNYNDNNYNKGVFNAGGTGSMQGTIKVGNKVTLNAQGGNAGTWNAATKLTSLAGGAGIGTGALIINEGYVQTPIRQDIAVLTSLLEDEPLLVSNEEDTENAANRLKVLGSLHKLSGHIVIGDDAVVNATGAFGAAGIGTGSDTVIHYERRIETEMQEVLKEIRQKYEAMAQKSMVALTAGDTLASQKCDRDETWLEIALKYMTNEFTHDNCKTTDSCEGGDAQVDPYLETVNIKGNAQVTATSGHELAASIGTGVIQCADVTSKTALESYKTKLEQEIVTYRRLLEGEEVKDTETPITQEKMEEQKKEEERVLEEIAQLEQKLAIVVRQLEGSAVDVKVDAAPGQFNLPVNSIYSIQRINGRTTLRDNAKVNLYVDNNYDGKPDADTTGGISDGNGMRLGFIGSSATIARDGTGAAQGGTWDEGPDEFVKYEIWHGVTLNGHYLCYDSGSDLSTAEQDALMANAVHYTKNADGTPHNFVFHCHHTDEEENGDHEHETPVVPVVPVVPVSVTETPVAPATVQTAAAEGEAAAAPAAAPAAATAAAAAKLPQTGAPVFSALGLALSGVALGIGSLFTKGKHEK